MADIIQLPKCYGPKRKRRALHEPCSVESLFSRPDAGMLYRRACKLDESLETRTTAERLYLECIRIDPSHHMAMTNLGSMAFRAQQFQAAESWYHRALAIDPTQSEALYNLGYLRLKVGAPELAVELFRKALASDSLFADAHYNLALALNQLEQWDAAETSMNRYLELEPTGVWSEQARKFIARLRHHVDRHVRKVENLWRGGQI
jgi:tetratricopeptide (TPR) repeat protein